MISRAKNSNKPMPAKSGYAVSRFNATKSGVFAANPVLPGEDADEYEATREAWVAELCPEGLFQMQYVEQIADISWRKHRLQNVEAGAIRLALRQLLGNSAKLVRSGDRMRFPNFAAENGTEEDELLYLVEMSADEASATLDQIEGELAIVSKAVKNIAPRSDLDQILDELPGDLRQTYADQLLSSGLDPYADGEAVGEAFEFEDGTMTVGEYRSLTLYSVLKQRETELTTQRRVLTHREEIRDAAQYMITEGSLYDKIARYEAHLDRRLERAFKNLMALKQFNSHAVSAGRASYEADIDIKGASATRRSGRTC